MTINIHHYHHYPELDTISEQLSLILKNQKTIMASTEELTAKLDELQTTVDDVQQQLADANAAKDQLLAQQATQIEALNTAKAALEAELANSVSPEQTQAAIAKIDATIADVKSTTATAAPDA